MVGVIMEKVHITLEEYSTTCSDGCCTDYGTVVTVNGKELQFHNTDTPTIIEQILKHLGYEATVDEQKVVYNNSKTN